MFINNQFDLLWIKYSKIISIKEIESFSKQLVNSGYTIRIKNYSVVYEKPTLKDLFLKLLSLIKGISLKLTSY
jgi:hypothetical protein